MAYKRIGNHIDVPKRHKLVLHGNIEETSVQAAEADIESKDKPNPS